MKSFIVHKIKGYMSDELLPFVTDLLKDTASIWQECNTWEEFESKIIYNDRDSRMDCQTAWELPVTIQKRLSDRNYLFYITLDNLKLILNKLN